MHRRVEVPFNFGGRSPSNCEGDLEMFSPTCATASGYRLTMCSRWGLGIAPVLAALTAVAMRPEQGKRPKPHQHVA